MRQLFIIITVLGFCSVLNAQTTDSIVVQVLIKDKKFHDPIQNVNVTLQRESGVEYFRTGSKGFFLFKEEKGKIVTIKLAHNQFGSLSVNERISDKIKADTVFLTLEMEFIKTQELSEITVAAPGVPIPVYSSDRLHVADFEIQKNGDLMLLTYPKRLKKGSELVLFDGIKTKQTFQVPETAEELLCDFRGNTHVVCSDNVYGVHILPAGNIGISTLARSYFMTYIAPIIDTNHAKLYFSNFNKDYPAFDYFAYDQLDSTYRKVLSIEDELMMELYRSEYKWVDVRTKLWAKNKEFETGIDAEIWVGANYFTQSIYYKELYAPLFQRNDSLYVFDYYKDKLYTFDRIGEPIDSVAIYHHYNPKITGWKKNLIQDRITGQIYAVFDRNGYSYLGLIDTKTGDIKEHVRLEYRYVDKIAVHNNSVYYIYRPFESIQKRYLYKEGLPYHFGNATISGTLDANID